MSTSALVVDTNILASLYLPGEFTAAAEDLLRTQADWSAPVLWRSEFRNILAGFMRRGQLSFEQALAIQLEAQSLLAGHEFDVDSQAVLELVRQSDCSAYDCEFVALAKQLGTRLATCDKKVLRNFVSVAFSIVATSQ